MPRKTTTSRREPVQLYQTVKLLPEILRSRQGASLVAFHLFDLLHTDLLKRSAGGVGRYGDRWAPLTPARRRWKAKHRPGTEHLINFFTGRLFRAFQPSSKPVRGYRPRREQIYDYSNHRLVLGVKVPYAVYVHARRKLFPEKHALLVKEAISRALTDTLDRLT